MVKRCIVHGCTSAEEETKFRSHVKRDGHAWCPVHERESDICQCSTSKPLFGHYVFPKSPGLRSVWKLLLGLDANFQPSNETVCSKHFEVSASQKRKIPVKNIGQNEEDVRRILADHVSTVIERHRQMKRPSTSTATVRLANATASAILALEDSYPNDSTDVFGKKICILYFSFASHLYFT